MSDDSTEEHFEHLEHAEHAAQSGARFLLVVSVTVAILAVAAATVGSFETVETAATLTEQNAATLLQNKASDQWAYFQAKSIKKSVYELAGRQGGALAPGFAAEAVRYDKEANDIRQQAEGLQHQVGEKLEAAERHERRHHLLTIAATLLHVSIAITTIAIITRGHKWPWLSGIAMASAGVVLALYAYV